MRCAGCTKKFGLGDKAVEVACQEVYCMDCVLVTYVTDIAFIQEPMLN